MYEGSLGGMIVPYGDPDVGWYLKPIWTPATTAWAP
jgi:Cu2+-containing amine oxidase